jgi:hypothetical protein
MTKMRNFDCENGSTDLGIFVNRYCTWGDHVDYISSKINTEFGLLKGIKSCLPLDGRKVKSFILPLIDYEDICWGDRGNENIDK